MRQYAALLERRVQSSTRVRKAQVVTRQTNPIGRSMIEMLGVLAIIGVLSVGGIAGYSKAMEMWKISRQKQQLAELFLQCINLKDDFLREYNRTNQRVKAATIMDAMNVIPEGMSNYGNYYTIRDSADNEISIYMETSRWTYEDGTKSSSFEYLLMFDIYQAETSNYLKQQYCVTFLEQAQAFSPYINGVQNRQADDSYGYNVKVIDIKTAKPNDIHNFCKKCNSNKQCTLVLYFKI